MTESEQLKKQADESLTRQRIDGLHAYLERLFSELEESHAARAKQLGMMTCTMCTWMISLFAMLYFGGTPLSIIEQLANILFWVVLGREWLFILPHYFGIVDEITGCITTLELLGMVDKNGSSRRRVKKYKESVIAKMWEALKSKRMREVFA